MTLIRIRDIATPIARDGLSVLVADASSSVNVDVERAASLVRAIGNMAEFDVDVPARIAGQRNSEAEGKRNPARAAR